MAAFKPAVTGLSEVPGDWPPDHELLASITGQAPEQVAPHRFDPPASPHLAAALSGHELEPAELVGAARGAAEQADVLLAEGVGGLLVPLTFEYSVRDFAADLGLPVLIAARPGLGTINHTLLTVEAARAAGLDVAAVVLTPWQARPTAVEQSNKSTIERVSGLAVHELPPLSAGGLVAGGSRLPLSQWFPPTRHTGGP